MKKLTEKVKQQVKTHIEDIILDERFYSLNLSKRLFMAQGKIFKNTILTEFINYYKKVDKHKVVSLNSEKLENLLTENIDTIYLTIDFGLLDRIEHNFYKSAGINFTEDTKPMIHTQSRQLNLLAKGAQKRLKKILNDTFDHDAISLSLFATTKKLTNKKQPKIKLYSGPEFIEITDKISYKIRKFYIAHIQNLSELI